MKLAVYWEEQMNTSVAIENEVEAEPARRRFTVDEFQRMGEAGIFAPDERVELIDGEVIQMTPVGPKHIWSVIHLNAYFTELLSGEFFVSPQSPVQVGRQQLNPDFAILRLQGGKAPGAVPQPEDCALLIEVADSSADFDKGEKSRLYAVVEIPEYWVLDLPRNCVRIHSRPRSGEYRQITEYPRGASFHSPALSGREFRVDDLLKYA
jgi:Uma2 family endonuclease